MMRRVSSALFGFLLLLSCAATAAVADEQLIREGKIDAAIASLQQRVQRNPADAESLNLLARAYYAIEDWDNAIEMNQRALKLDPNSSAFHSWMGRAYGEKADTVGIFGAASLARKTKSEFEKAVQLNPADSQARLDVSEYYTQAPGFMGGGTDKARQQADAVAHFDAAASHLIRARIAQQDKKYDEAETEFKAAIAASKTPGGYWINLASFYQSRGRLPEMEKALTSAVAARGGQSVVLYDAASVLNRAGRNLPGAVQFLKQYLADAKFDEDSPAFRAHFLMGQIYEKMQRKNDAAVEYRAALGLASNFKKAQTALAHLQD